MVRIARHLRQTVLLLRSLRRPPLPTLPLPKRRRCQLQVQGPRALCLLVARLLLRVVVALAGVLVQRPHLTTLATEVLMSLLAATRVVTRAVTEITASAGLLPTIPLTTLRAAVGAAGALAAVLLVVLVALGVLAPGTATCPGTRFGSS